MFNPCLISVNENELNELPNKIAQSEDANL